MGNQIRSQPTRRRCPSPRTFGMRFLSTVNTCLTRPLSTLFTGARPSPLLPLGKAVSSIVKSVGSGRMLTPRGGRPPIPPSPQQQQQASASSMQGGGGGPEGAAPPGVVLVSTPRGGLLGSFTSKLGGMVGRRGAVAEPSILSKITYTG